MKKCYWPYHIVFQIAVCCLSAQWHRRPAARERNTGLHSILFGWLIYLSLMLGPSPGWAQTPLPPSLLNHNILPPSPEAAALGRFGEVPVSLYTGVPSIAIPLGSLPGRTLSVPLSLQYHGGGVRPDQVAPWTGMNWTLNAGGVITRTCRGLPDFGGYFPPNTRPVPLGITSWCKNQSDSADSTNYYDYIQHVLEGAEDSQPDLFTFNFMGYSGQIIFDQQGKAYTIPTQPIEIQAPHGAAANYWTLKTPDGAEYQFGSIETSNYSPSAWYLTRIISADHEQIDLQYQAYSTELTYPNPYTTSAISTQTVFAGPYHCDTCPRELSIGDRQPTRINGQYLRRIISATHRVDFLSAATRLDQPGTRQLNTMRLTYLADSSRFLEYRFRYVYYDPWLHDRLFLQQVQKVGRTASGEEVTEPPYTFAYVPAPSDIPARGTYAIDRWGYYNAAPNHNPFLKLDGQAYQQLPPANRETNPTAVTFGLLQQITYPTGGTTKLEFEANDFSNIAQPLYDTTDSTQTAFSQSDGTGTSLRVRPITFTLTHTQLVEFTYTTAFSGENGEPITDLDTHANLYATGSSTPVVFNYATASNLQSFRRQLDAGTYRVDVYLDPWKEATAQVLVHYVQRQPRAVIKQPGGGTRIHRMVTSDGISHANDQIKEYYYDNEQHTRSTGKLIHQPVFHANFSYILVNGGGGTENSCFIALGQEWECKYWIHAADDLAAASGTAQGSAVGYDTVTVVQRDLGTTLRTTSIFHNVAAAAVTLDDQAIENQGFIPINFDTQNGLLLQTREYRTAIGGDPFRRQDTQLTRVVTNQYGSPTVPEVSIVGLSIGGSFGSFKADSHEPCRTITAQSYTTRVGWWPLTQTEEVLYDQAGLASTTTTRILYDNAAHLQPSRKEVTTSMGGTQITRYKYALDYAPSADRGIGYLQDHHLILPPVEQQQWVQAAGQPPRWVGGSITRFGTTATGIVVPTAQYQASLAEPASSLAEVTDATQRYVDLLPSAAYTLRATVRYNPVGTIAQQALVHDQPSAYLWGYQNLFPIAQARNASVAQVAYTSFEATAPGRWQYDSLGQRFRANRFTGKRSYAVDGTPAAAVRSRMLPAGEYELLVWIQGAGFPVLTGATRQERTLVATAREDWKQYRFRAGLPANGQLTLNSAPGKTLLVDELRLAPVTAHLTTLTHDGLFGLSSQTGPDGRTLFYEYDGLGRLVRTRDEQGRILSQKQYHYAGGN